MVDFTLTVGNSGYLENDIRIVDYFEDRNLQYVSYTSTIPGLAAPTVVEAIGDFDQLVWDSVPLVD